MRENEKLFCCLTNSVNQNKSSSKQNLFERSLNETGKTPDSSSLNQSETENLTVSINTFTRKPSLGGPSSQSHFQTTFKITEYFKEEFESLRRMFDIDNKQFYHSLGSSEFFETSGGKSKSDFMITVDRKVGINSTSSRPSTRRKTNIFYSLPRTTSTTSSRESTIKVLVTSTWCMVHSRRENSPISSWKTSRTSPKTTLVTLKRSI